MLDPLIRHAAEVLAHAAETVLFRYEKIKHLGSSGYSDDELTILDAIAMQLQVVGEKIKKIEQLSPGFLKQHGINAKQIIRMRDFLSHHYEDVDYASLLETCRELLPDLAQKIKIILAED